MRRYGIRTLDQRVAWRSVWISVILAALGEQGLFAEEVRPFAITNWGGYGELRFVGERQSQSRLQPSPSWTSTELQMREGVDIDLDGYVYHPHLAKLHMSTLVEWIQDSFDFGTTRGDQQTFPLSGDISATFLEGRPDTLVLGASRKELDIIQQFGRTLHMETMSEHAALSIHNLKSFPIEVTYDHRTQLGIRGTPDINQVEDDFAVRSHYTLSERSEGNAEYSLTRIQDRAFLHTTQLRQYNIDNTTYIDQAKKLRLYGAIRLSEQQESTKITTFSAQENLEWRHTDRLQTRYHVGLDETVVGSQNIRVWNVESSLSHRMFESLLSNVDTYARYEQASFGTVKTYGGSLGESYTQPLANWGQLGLSARGFGEEVESQLSAPLATVKGETHVMSHGTPVTLGHTQIDLTSIVVSDEHGVRIYTRGIDYVILAIGDPPQLVASAVGGIPDGSTVRVDYTYKLPGNGKVLTVGGELGARFMVGNWLTVYSRYGRTEQSQVTGIPVTQLESLKLAVVGATLTWRGMMVGSEYENRDSVLSPSESLSEWASVSRTLLQRVNGMVSATHRYTTLGQFTGRSVDAVEVAGTVNVKVTERSNLSLDAEYRRQVWDAADATNDLDGYGLKGEFMWRYRKLSAKLNGRMSKVNQLAQKENQYQVDLVIRRDF